jgi:hypothetical protein
MITYPANSYCCQAKSLRQYTTVCHLMMVVWPKHVVAVTSEEEKKSCCVGGPIITLLIIHTQQEASPQCMITYPANSYCSQAKSLRQYTTVCRMMMVVWPKHVVAVTSEEEKKNCCVGGPIIALLIIHTQQEASPQCMIIYPANSCCSQAKSLRQYTTVCHLMMVVWPKHVVAVTSEEELLRWRAINE